MRWIHHGATILAWSALLGLTRMPARADTAAPQLPAIVVDATAIPGNAIDADKIPGNVQTLYATDLAREGAASLTAALDAQLGSVNINDNLDDPFQPDILYRGFEASPVLGTPQGLAVYQNGVRINEAFGATVNWDLFPDIAIERVDIVSASPVYGLNALGGGISVGMKDGFSYHGTDLELSGGSFDQRSAALQYGANDGRFGLYVAGRTLDQDGWRMFSGDSVRQLYAVLSERSQRSSLDLRYTHADNQLLGQGAAPVQELAVSRYLVFTEPQANVNQLDFLTLNGSLKLTQSWSLQGVLYYRQYAQSVSNGNTTDYTACSGGTGAGLLCQPDGVTPLSNSQGGALPDISDGGMIPIGENDFETIHAYGRGAALQTTTDYTLFGHTNQFTAGATLDYALVSFYSGTQLGVIGSNLLVQPSNLIVDTSEAQQNAAIAAGDQAISATPVSLLAVNRDVGLYATDTLDLTPALAMTLSARYNIADIDLRDQLGSDLSGDNHYSHLNPGLGATYKVLPVLTAYAGVSANTRTPTASEIECSNPLQPCLLPSNLASDPPSLRQVVAHTGELGLRGTLAAMSWNLSLFRTQLHDDIYGIATSLSSGFFQNIGATRRQGIEAGFRYQHGPWSAYANYGYVDASFQSAIELPSPSNPFQDANANIQVEPGDRLPGIPQHRFKTGVDWRPQGNWTLGATLRVISAAYIFGDESNQSAPLPGYHVLGLHASYQINPIIQLYATLSNVLNAKYATYGIFGDPTGIGAPGIAPNAATNGPGVDNRFESPAAPIAAYGGIRIAF